MDLFEKRTMVRIVIENLLLFLSPTLIYLTYAFVKRQAEGSKEPIFDDAPILWLSSAGALLVVVVLVSFGWNSGGQPGQTYEPAVYKDGVIQPGRIK